MWTLPAAQLQCSDGEQKDAEQRALLREQRAVEMRELHGAGQVGSGGGGGRNGGWGAQTHPPSGG